MNKQDIKAIIEQQSAELFSGSLSLIKDAETGEPMPMLDFNDKQTHWFIPFVLHHKALGFAITNLSGKIILHGSLTPNAKEKIDLAFFSQLPSHLLADLKKSYQGFNIVSQSFSYDGSPHRWAWRVNLDNGEQKHTLFVSPSGWYEKKEQKPGLEA